MQIFLTSQFSTQTYPRYPLGRAVAKMLADTVETVEEYYAQFVPAARDAVQVKRDSAVGIEEQDKIAAQRGRKVGGIR